MSGATMVKRLADVLDTQSFCELGKQIGYHGSMVWSFLRAQDIKLSTLQRIHERTRIPVGVLAEWFIEERPGYEPPEPGEPVPGLTPEIEARMFGAAQQPERETP